MRVKDREHPGMLSRGREAEEREGVPIVTPPPPVAKMGVALPMALMAGGLALGAAVAKKKR